jgi:Protein of unknown function (DUF2877)
VAKPEHISPVTIDGSFPIQVPVLWIGPVAVRVLARGGRGRVNAVFERSFYCEIGGANVCVGSAALGMGAINIVATDPALGMQNSPELCVGLSVNISCGCVLIGDRFLLTLAGASIWAPPSVSAWSPTSAASGLEALVTIAVPRIPGEGLGRFLAPALTWEEVDNPVLRHAVGPLHRLQDRLRAALRDPRGAIDLDTPSWQDLLGLGPGLTPSGDDLIGGIMLTLHCLGEKRALEVLSSAVAGAMRERTHSISAAHLAAAMEGLGGEAAHVAINAILSGNHKILSDVIAALGRIGHTSGWDMLAGIAIAVRLWLDCVAERQSITCITF